MLATDGGHQALTGTLDISIEVTDANDNSPVFDKSTINTTVSENAPTGWIVTQLRATDNDIGVNAHVTYKLSDQSASEYGDIFKIDSQSGELYLGKELDREKQDFYRIHVVAADSAEVDKKSAHASISVHVLDVNDNSPHIRMYAKRDTPLEISSMSGPDTFVQHFVVNDNDLGNNARFWCWL
ncbi:hypothetical protein HELRODRAFT_63116, partial [Helobdella robusta]|uniref:Cadherin domain-containing protein n=1 Tax=Helobdella robusta TaxID=6412 RepID=T1FXB2_HELRO